MRLQIATSNDGFGGLWGKCRFEVTICDLKRNPDYWMAKCRSFNYSPFANMATRALIPAERIEATILTIRGQRVMLDSDLAAIYRVTTLRAAR